jgi:hypothetical protein
MVYTPSIKTHLSNAHYSTARHKKLEVTTAANPHILRTRVTECPNGLSSGLSWPLTLSQGQSRGLAAPNIDNIGHIVPKTENMGRRRHFSNKLLVLHRAMCLLMCNVFVVRHIGCCGYDTTVSQSCNSPCGAPSRPLSSGSLSN